MLHSCLYRGWVRHRRREPVQNEFTYNVFFAYLDLEELDHVFKGRWLWSTSRMAIARFRRDDHFGDPSQPLATCVRDLVENQTGARPSGPIRMLSQLRFYGYLMNPVAFFYCFNDAGTEVESVVAEVTNTPWGETHCYVLDQATLTGSGPNTHKEFHVSPFMEMNMEYAWKAGTPGATLSMHIDENKTSATEPEQAFFDVTTSLKRHEITGFNLAAALVRHPFMTGKIAAAIYWQAMKLWWKGCPFVPHPSKTDQPRTAISIEKSVACQANSPRAAGATLPLETAATLD